MFRMYKLILLVLVIFSFSLDSEARVLSLAESINKSGQQRMLSQRIAKNYLLIMHRINAKDASIELDDSVATFEDNLFNLQDTVSTKDSKAKIKELRKVWEQFRRLVLDKRTTDHSKRVLVMNNTLLKAAHQLVLSLEKTSSAESARLINISGRQRMLSQRIALYYTASYVGYRDDKYHKNFNTAVKEFNEGLNYLMKSKGNTEEIATSLSAVKRQWKFYQNKFVDLGSQTYVPRVIRVITEKFLSQMHRITKMYELTLKQ